MNKVLADTGVPQHLRASPLPPASSAGHHCSHPVMGCIGHQAAQSILTPRDNHHPIAASTPHFGSWRHLGHEGVLCILFCVGTWIPSKPAAAFPGWSPWREVGGEDDSAKEELKDRHPGSYSSAWLFPMGCDGGGKQQGVPDKHAPVPRCGCSAKPTLMERVQADSEVGQLGS